MVSKPVRRYSGRKTRAVEKAEGLAKLYEIGPYDRNQVTLSQIRRIQEIIDLQGFESAAELIGVGQTCLLKVTSGFAHKLSVRTAAKVREFLTGRS